MTASRIAAGRPTILSAKTERTRYTWDMEKDLKIDVATLDTPHRRALEEVIGQQLAANQRLIISNTEVEVPPSE